MSYENDEWWNEDDEDYGDWDDWFDPDYYEYADQDDPEPRPLTLLERIDEWFSHTRIGQFLHDHTRRHIDVDDIPF